MDKILVILIFLILAALLLGVLLYVTPAGAESCPTPTALGYGNQAWYLPIVRNWSATATPEPVVTPESVEPTRDCSRPHGPDCKRDAAPSGGFTINLKPGENIEYTTPGGFGGRITYQFRTSICYTVREYWQNGVWEVYDMPQIPIGSMMFETPIWPELYCSVVFDELEVSSQVKTPYYKIYAPMVRYLRRYAPGQ